MRSQLAQMQMAQQEIQMLQSSLPTATQHQQRMPVAPAEAASDQNLQDVQHPQSMSGMQPRSNA
jgi:hypothetical protein